MAAVEDVLARAERHVREGEARLTRQADLVARMAARGLDPRLAQDTLERLRSTLSLWHDDLARLRQARGLPVEDRQGPGPP